MRELFVIFAIGLVLSILVLIFIKLKKPCYLNPLFINQNDKDLWE